MRNIISEHIKSAQSEKITGKIGTQLRMLKSHIELFEESLGVGAYSELPQLIDMIVREAQYLDSTVSKLHTSVYGEGEYTPLKERNVFDTNYLMNPEFQE